MCPSDIADFFDTKQFKDYQKNKASEIKIQVAGVNRLNDVIKAIGMLGKALSR